MRTNVFFRKSLLALSLIVTMSFTLKAIDVQPDSTCRSRVFDSQTFTSYDWQTNAGAITRTIVWEDGTVNFAYTQATTSDFSDRGTGISTYHSNTGTWSHTNGKVETIKSGYGSIARYGANGIVLASHTGTDCRVYIINDKNNIQPNSLTAISALDNTYNPRWPNVMTSGATRNIIHVIAQANSNSSPTGYPDQPLYFRSQDGGYTWDKQNVVLPFTEVSPDVCEAWSGANICYWMETTDDNCLALVVNNPWSEGIVIYSYDNGETWQKKVFYDYPGWLWQDSWARDRYFYPRYTSCQWDSHHRLHVLYEFSGKPVDAPNNYFTNLGGVAYWNEYLPYNNNGTAQSSIPGNLTPGQPFVMDTAYLWNDIYASWWLWSDASHEMWPEYIGYLSPLDVNGNPEDPYSATEFNIDDRTHHGLYNCGVCGFPVLCFVPDTDYMVAVWCAMDENNVDANGNFYFKLFASHSLDGGRTWSRQIALTNDSDYDNCELVYPQAAIVDNKLIIAVQKDGQTGTYVENQEGTNGTWTDNYYAFKAYELSELFDFTPISYNITVTANPASGGVVTGAGSYNYGTTCNLNATANNGYIFVTWTKGNEVVSTNVAYSFNVTEAGNYVANFQNVDGIEETINDGISVYPNPANDIIFVESDMLFNCCEIYTLTGQLVYESADCQNKMQINVSDLASGSYIIKMVSDDKVITRRFVRK